MKNPLPRVTTLALVGVTSLASIAACDAARETPTETTATSSQDITRSGSGIIRNPFAPSWSPA